MLGTCIFKQNNRTMVRQNGYKNFFDMILQVQYTKRLCYLFCGSLQLMPFVELALVAQVALLLAALQLLALPPVHPLESVQFERFSLHSNA